MGRRRQPLEPELRALSARMRALADATGGVITAAQARAGKYDEPGSLFAEKQREDWLRDAHDVEVVRWVPGEMRTPGSRHEVATRFVRAFRRRS